MQTRKSFFQKPLVIAALGCLVFAAVACGDDDDSSGNPAPTGGTKATGGTSSTTAGKTSGGTSSNTAGKSGTTAGTNSEPTGGGGAGSVDMPVGGAGGESQQSCTDDLDNGCYRCKPSTLTQFINACPTTGCEPFDNSALTSITKAGKLPALP